MARASNRIDSAAMLASRPPKSRRKSGRRRTVRMGPSGGVVRGVARSGWRGRDRRRPSGRRALPRVLFSARHAPTGTSGTGRAVHTDRGGRISYSYRRVCGGRRKRGHRASCLTQPDPAPPQVGHRAAPAARGRGPHRRPGHRADRLGVRVQVVPAWRTAAAARTRTTSRVPAGPLRRRRGAARRAARHHRGGRRHPRLAAATTR